MFNEINSTVYQNVKALCERKGIKLTDFEVENGLTKGFLAKKSKSPSDIGLQLCLQLSAKLEVELSDLLDTRTAFKCRISAIECEIQEYLSKIDTLAEEKENLLKCVHFGE